MYQRSIDLRLTDDEQQISVAKLSKMLHNYMEEFAKEIDEEYQIPQALEDLRTVLLSGDALDTEHQAMRVALRSALTEHAGKLRTSLDPQFVASFGAAQRARHISLNPTFLNDEETGQILPEREAHQELQKSHHQVTNHVSLAPLCDSMSELPT